MEAITNFRNVSKPVQKHFTYHRKVLFLKREYKTHLSNFFHSFENCLETQNDDDFTGKN